MNLFVWVSLSLSFTLSLSISLSHTISLSLSLSLLPISLIYIWTMLSYYIFISIIQSIADNYHMSLVTPSSHLLPTTFPSQSLPLPLPLFLSLSRHILPSCLSVTLVLSSCPICAHSIEPIRTCVFLISPAISSHVIMSNLIENSIDWEIIKQIIKLTYWWLNT